MNVNEMDLDLLEQHLDCALDAAASSHLQARLADDSSLADALSELKAQRAVRAAVWQSMHPDTVAADRLTWRIRGAMLNQDRAAAEMAPSQSRNLWNPWRFASICSAAAACVLLGFAVGRIGHGPNTTDQEKAIITSEGGSTPLAVNIPHGAPLPNLTPAPYTGPKISVPFTDPDTGTVVAWQTFDNPEQAKKFTEDLHAARTQSPPPASAGNTRTVDQEQVHF
jgi:hypothetical protein